MASGGKGNPPVQNDQYNKQFEVFLSKLKWKTDPEVKVKKEVVSEDEETSVTPQNVPDDPVQAESSTADNPTSTTPDIKPTIKELPKIGNFICTECSRIFRKRQSLIKHKQRAHSDQTERQNFRTRAIANRVAKWSHLYRPREGSGQKSCPYCDKTFVGLSRRYLLHVEQHRAAMDGPGRRRKKIATLTLAAAAQKRKHQGKRWKKVVPKPPPEVVVKVEPPEFSPPPPPLTDFTCSVCHKHFTSKDHYKRHMAYHREVARGIRINKRKKDYAPDTALSDSRCLGCKRSLNNQAELRNHLWHKTNDSKHFYLARYMLTHNFNTMPKPPPVETFNYLTTNPFHPYDPPSQLLNPDAFDRPLDPNDCKEEQTLLESSSQDPEEGMVSEEPTELECSPCSLYFKDEAAFNKHYLDRQDDELHSWVAQYILIHTT